MSGSLQPGRFFLPGPTEVHPDVLGAQAQPMIGHRGPAIEELMARIQDGLKPLFTTEKPVIVSTSSATGLMEAAVRNGVDGGRVLSLVNGAFSGRFAQIARTCGVEVDAWEVPWGDVHSPDELEDRLSAGDYSAVTLSHSETSTGALQDLESIGDVVGGHAETLLLVDSVTGVGGVATKTDEWGLDFVLTGSQKALALPPGLAFGVASEAMMGRSRTVANRGWYFALDRLADKLESFQTPATPAVSLLYALDFQLDRISREGVSTRWDRHLEMQARTFQWVEEVAASGGDVGVFAREGHRSPTVTCVSTPDGVAPDVVSQLASRGWVIGGGYGKLKPTTFRVGHMGDHTVEELDALLAELTALLT